MNEAIYEKYRIDLVEEIEKVGINEVKIRADKRAYTCPFCHEFMTIKAGDDRDAHFAHLPRKTCLISISSDTYYEQTKRENKQHSVIRDFIFDELKTQEKTKPDLHVEYGYLEKAAEKWRVYPDIMLKKGDREIGISVLTNVKGHGDENIVRMIRKRNKFFADKGLYVLWFVEDRELAIDHTHRVIHLWESEYHLALKTDWDLRWDAFLQIMSKGGEIQLSDVMGYRHRSELNLDVRSLYYVHTLGETITFSVYRFILDENKSPFRAFAVTKGYKLGFSTALAVKDTVSLADDAFEREEMDQFEVDLAERIKQAVEEREEELQRSKQIAATVVVDYQTLHRHSAVEVEVPEPKIPENDSAPMQVDDGTVIALFARLKNKTILADEAWLLYEYIRRNREFIIFKGYSMDQIKRLATQALGHIGHESVRTPLVEIEEYTKQYL